MKRASIPEGFAVVQLADKQWYPLEASRLYGVEHPDGVYASLFTFFDPDGKDLCFSTQREAVIECQAQARMSEEIRQGRWEQLSTASNVYPERCAHYVSIIEERTGKTPIVTNHYREISVFLAGDYCPHCDTWMNCISVTAIAIEYALEEVAEQVYTQRCQCKQMDIAYQELLTA